MLLVTRLDRLARSTRDLLNTLAAIAEKGARFRSLGDTWADTTTAHGRLILTVLGGLAEFERELIRARTGEGRARAVANGVKMGRKPKLTPHQKKEARNAAPRREEKKSRRRDRALLRRQPVDGSRDLHCEAKMSVDRRAYATEAFDTINKLVQVGGATGGSAPPYLGFFWAESHECVHSPAFDDWYTGDLGVSKSDVPSGAY